MARYESALDELASRLTGTDASLASSLSDILASALQELIETELTARIGAEPGERTPTRVAQRNGQADRRRGCDPATAARRWLARSGCRCIWAGQRAGLRPGRSG